MVAPAPRKIGRYELFGALASGGMATVHVGRLRGSAGFKRTVAIKRLHAQLAEDAEFVAMFRDEARLAGHIRHSNVVSVIDAVAIDGEVLLVMEYVQGESLSRLMKSGRPPPAVVAAIVCDALEGLHAAHEAHDEHGQPLGIVHRDVSPQNIIVGIDGIARVLDFGIAKASNRTQVTREGQLKGKLAYMSPEQLHHKPVTRAVDIHAMGIVLWEGLTGERLFAASTEAETVTKVLFDVREPPSKLGAPATYDEITLKALATQPDERFATAHEMAIAIRTCAPKADTHEVAEWVTRVAKKALDERRELIAQIESGQASRVQEEPSLTETRLDLSTEARSHRGSRSRGPIAFVVGIGAVGAIGAAIFWNAHRTTAATRADPIESVAPIATTIPTNAASVSAPASAPVETPHASAAHVVHEAPAARASASSKPAVTTIAPQPSASATPSVALPDHL